MLPAPSYQIKIWEVVKGIKFINSFSSLSYPILLLSDILKTFWVSSVLTSLL